MHAIIDYFAWIVIGLVLLAALFLIGAAGILIHEGFKALVKAFRTPAIAQENPSQGYNRSQTAAPAAYQATQPVDPPPASPQRAPIAVSGWRMARMKLQTVKSGAHLQVHIRHHKAAGAKP